MVFWKVLWFISWKQYKFMFGVKGPSSHFRCKMNHLFDDSFKHPLTLNWPFILFFSLPTLLCLHSFCFSLTSSLIVYKFIELLIATSIYSRLSFAILSVTACFIDLIAQMDPVEFDYLYAHAMNKSMIRCSFCSRNIIITP